MATEEHSLNFPHEEPGPQAESTLFRYVQSMLEARRYRDPRDQDPDYGRRLRELEGQIAEIDREQTSFKMGDYHEGGGNKWDKWLIPGLVTLAVSGIIGQVLQYAKTEALRQEVTDMRVELNDLKKLVEPRYRGG